MTARTSSIFRPQVYGLADYAEAAGEGVQGVRFVTGLRWWF